MGTTPREPETERTAKEVADWLAIGEAMAEAGRRATAMNARPRPEGIDRNGNPLPKGVTYREDIP